MAHLVTGHAGTEHIKPSDDGAFNAGVVGAGKYVLDLGNKFAYEIVSNNLVKILDGELVNQGRHMNIPANNYEEVPIENGLQSVKRHDLICMRYTKNADTSIEKAELVVVKGTSSESPTDPEYISGDIFGGDLTDDFPLYRVRLDGLNIEGVDCLFDTIPSLEVVNAKAETNATEIAAMKETKTGKFEHVLDTGTYSNETLQKQDGIVYLTCRLHNASVTGYTTNWITLPEGFRPKAQTTLLGIAVVNGTRMPIQMIIPTNGKIQQSYGAVEATELAVSGSFIAAE